MKKITHAHIRLKGTPFSCACGNTDLPRGSLSSTAVSHNLQVAYARRDGTGRNGTGRSTHFETARTSGAKLSILPSAAFSLCCRIRRKDRFSTRTASSYIIPQDARRLKEDTRHDARREGGVTMIYLREEQMSQTTARPEFARKESLKIKPAGERGKASSSRCRGKAGKTTGRM